jgi:hypothetical protein
MPVFIAVGQTGTLRFIADMAGLDPAVIQSQQWQLQGTPASLKFTAPDKVEGLAEGTANMRVQVTSQIPGSPQERQTYRFEVQTVPAGPPTPPKMVPVAIDITGPTL